jgi:hypothetical protein
VNSQVAYLDTEFDAPTDTLLSIALVLEDGSEFYVVISDHAEDEWVQKNVLPKLVLPAIGRTMAQQKLEAFLKPFDSLHIVADWPQDIAYMAELMITSPGMAITTPRLTWEWERKLNTNASMTPHNALADARALKEMDKGVLT